MGTFRGRRIFHAAVRWRGNSERVTIARWLAVEGVMRLQAGSLCYEHLGELS
jgi:hypothetical protein